MFCPKVLLLMLRSKLLKKAGEKFQFLAKFTTRFSVPVGHSLNALCVMALCDRIIYDITNCDNLR